MKKVIQNKGLKLVIFEIILLVAAVLLDMTYAGKVKNSFLLEIVEALRKLLGSIGFSYRKAFEILEKNIGVLISTISLLLTIGINIADRYEAKIFGLGRSQLYHLQTQALYVVMKRMAYLLPVALILFIIQGWCVAGYLVLIHSYIYLIMDSVYLYRSYGKENDYQVVVNCLLGTIKENGSNENIELTNFRMVLSDVALNAEGEGWGNTERLYQYFLEELTNRPTFLNYSLNYLFFNTVFCNGSRDRNCQESVHCAKLAVNDLCNRSIDGNTNANFILWGMIGSVLNEWDGESMQNFLSWFLDFPLRSNSLRKDDGCGGKYLAMRRQAGVVILGVEGWLKMNLSERMFISSHIKMLWEYGKIIFEEEEENFLDECCHMAEKLVESNSALNWRGLVGNLKEDYKNSRSRSHIDTLIREMSEVAG